MKLIIIKMNFEERKPKKKLIKKVVTSINDDVQ
jgi:hypothetical protein